MATCKFLSVSLPSFLAPPTYQNMNTGPFPIEPPLHPLQTKRIQLQARYHYLLLDSPLQLLNTPFDTPAGKGLNSLHFSY